jgi:hypothetical protein
VTNLEKSRLLLATVFLIISAIPTTINLLLFFVEIKRKIKKETKKTPSSIALVSLVFALISLILAYSNSYIFYIALAVIFLDPQNWLLLYLGFLGLKEFLNKKAIN